MSKSRTAHYFLVKGGTILADTIVDASIPGPADTARARFSHMIEANPGSAIYLRLMDEPQVDEVLIGHLGKLHS